MNLKNTTNEDTKKNINDAFIFGDDCWKLITKFSSESRGTMKSTKAMKCGKDVVIQVTTQQGNNISEAITFVPGVRIKEEYNTEQVATVTSRKLVKI